MTFPKRCRLGLGFRFRREKTQFKPFSLKSMTTFSWCAYYSLVCSSSASSNQDNGTISNEEFLVLYDLYFSKNADFLYTSYTSFDLERSIYLAEFCFRKRDIPRQYNVLQIPDTITCSQRSLCDGIEGIFMPLKCLSHSYRNGDKII